MPYFAPEKIEEALQFLQETNAKIVAGGTDFFPNQSQGEMFENVLDVTKITDCRGIRKSGDGWRIGAATTWTDIVKAELPSAFDGLKLAAREVGSVQIQNQGTVAGNICNASPAADGVPPLLTLNAGIEVISRMGRRIIPLESFLTGVRQTALSSDELVASLHIPLISQSAKSCFLKLGSRKHLVISIAMVAVIVDITDNVISEARIAVGSCSPVAKRLLELEKALIGLSVKDVADSQFSMKSHYEALNPISDVRGTAEYRLQSVEELCRRAIEKAMNGN